MLRMPYATKYFYPRPPRGGRQDAGSLPPGTCHFYPRPPRGGRPSTGPQRSKPRVFLSTPSARRATDIRTHLFMLQSISIHALREEGDIRRVWDVIFYIISIHALREEGDLPFLPAVPHTIHFYPRPPRGGRLDNGGKQLYNVGISIHALREEGDRPANVQNSIPSVISIHALREEGDLPGLRIFDVL